jgi:predicted metal-dependent HD superfamily phosphohydrolase
MDVPLIADLTQRLSLDCPPGLLERLRVRYEEPHRAYHTWEHVLACLDARRRITDTDLPEVDLALLFHDAVYEPLAGDNEARSGLLLIEEGRRAWMNERLLRRAQLLIDATQHGPANEVDSEEACIVVDADLSILGSEPGAFARYEEQVRREYAMVAEAAYVVGRAGVLEGFLSRPTIYATRRGQRLWERRARSNLEASLVRLRTL